MTSILARNIKRYCAALGLDISRARPENMVAARRARYLLTSGITVVFDVGANIGSYGEMIRASGYSGKIISFEPLAVPFEELSRKTVCDTHWTGFRCALGSADGEATINIAGNSVSSSVLPMTDTHTRVAPESANIGTETIEIRRLDTVAADILGSKDMPFIKIDVQGFEKDVLEGCGDLMNRIAGIEIELSMVELYEGQLLFREIVDYLDDRGFCPVSFERGLTDPISLQVLQMDGIFLNNSISQ
ncbi:MAG: FkbM family methyltransferase [Alphaproteobacteria bacterium]|nr:FkbM family methyltransferase [Alphaproteobacteria bacterium]